MKNKQSSLIATWTFGSSLLVFYICVFLFAPPALPEFKQRMLGLISALLAGLFGFFLTGAIGLELKTANSPSGQLVIKATGGTALFVFMLWFWFGPFAPVAIETTLKKTTEIEQYTKGGAFPQIQVELYFGPTNGMHKTMITIPPNPGFVAVLIENTNDFPIYDLTISMMGDYDKKGQFSQTMQAFNSDIKPFPVLLPNRPFCIILPANPNTNRVDYTFYTQTRSGQSHQRFRYLVVNNRWEYAHNVVDTQSSNVITEEVSANFPHNNNGAPVW